MELWIWFQFIEFADVRFTLTLCGYLNYYFSLIRPEIFEFYTVTNVYTM